MSGLALVDLGFERYALAQGRHRSKTREKVRSGRDNTRNEETRLFSRSRFVAYAKEVKIVHLSARTNDSS